MRQMAVPARDPQSAASSFHDVNAWAEAQLGVTKGAPVRWHSKWSYVLQSGRWRKHSHSRGEECIRKTVLRHGAARACHPSVFRSGILLEAPET